MIRDAKDLVAAMQREPWTEFWIHMNIALFTFEDVGLTPISADQDIWFCCQREQLVLLTDNRNKDSEDSLTATINTYNEAESIPVMTISNLRRFRTSKTYADRVLKKLLNNLLDIQNLLGAGRLYLP